MTFTEATRSCLRQFVGFSGRASRSEFWWFMVFNVVVGAVTAVVDIANSTTFFNDAAAVVLFLPNLAVIVRRLHDTGRSAWWLLIGLVPVVGVIVLLVWLCSYRMGLNQYGSDPRGVPPTVYGTYTY